MLKPAYAGFRILDLDRGLPSLRITTQDAAVSMVPWDNEQAVKVVTGHTDLKPGITIPAPGGEWDLSRFASVMIDIKNLGQMPLTVHCRLDGPGSNHLDNCCSGEITLRPREAKTWAVRLIRKSAPGASKMFPGMQGYPPEHGDTRGIDPSHVTQMVFFVAQTKETRSFELSQFLVGEQYQPAPAGRAFFPFIDRFGQYSHAHWQWKIDSEADLRERRHDEERTFKEMPGPGDWDTYGGWRAGPTLKPAGKFRTWKYDGKWWLVDPDGHLFFSHGIDSVRPSEPTPINGRSNWFQNFPGNDPQFKEFLQPAGPAERGAYPGKSPSSFDFAGANLKRKYGPQWKAQWELTTGRRLRSWGINTIGCWSDPALCAMHRMPYTTFLQYASRPIGGSQGSRRRFPDVFDRDFEAQLRTGMAQEARRSATDPWCIGYFVDNELSWGDDTSLALAALLSPPEQPAKRVFVQDLKQKYGGIERLNGLWGTSYPSWNALLASRAAPDRIKAGEDLRTFSGRIAERYFKTVRGIIRAGAPGRLYLGCRFASVNHLAAATAAKYCDVVSFNLYWRSVAGFHPPMMADVPLLISEFNFGALDRGLFHPGRVPVENQDDRGLAYREYVEGALHHSQIVGCHWFEYGDQPTTGRVEDGENHQTGFVDIADNPYSETIDACQQVAYNLYWIRAQNGAVDDIKSILALPNPSRAVKELENRLDTLYGQHIKLKEAELTFLAMRHLLHSVAWDGFSGWLMNGGGLAMNRAYLGYKDVGATKTVDIIRRAMSIFPGGRPSSDPEIYARQMAHLKYFEPQKKLLNDLDDEFYKFEESPDVYALRYVVKHQRQFTTHL